jgi:hypothetical protein
LACRHSIQLIEGILIFWHQNLTPNTTTGRAQISPSECANAKIFIPGKPRIGWTRFDSRASYVATALTRCHPTQLIEEILIFCHRSLRYENFSRWLSSSSSVV